MRTCSKRSFTRIRLSATNWNFGLSKRLSCKTGDEAEADQLADLADLPQEAEVEDEVVLLARSQVIEQLVHDEKQAVIGVLLAELRHHGGQVVLVAVHLVVGWEAEGDSLIAEEVLDPAADDVPQALLGRGDLEADHLELPGDRLRPVRHSLVLDDFHHVGLLGDARDQREQVALACAVVADDEDALVVGRFQKLKIREDKIGQLLGHPVRDDERLNELTGILGRFRLLELDDGDVMKTWPCADFSFIRDLLRILSCCKPVFAGIEPILPTSLGTSPRRPSPDIAQAPRRSFQLSASRQSPRG